MSFFLITESGDILATESGTLFIGEATETQQEVQFIDQSIGATSFFWDFGDGTFSVQENPRHNFPSSGAWVVSLTASNSAGQTSRVQRAVVTKPCLVIPPAPLLVVFVNGVNVGNGGEYLFGGSTSTLLRGETVNYPLAITLQNFGVVPLHVSAFSIFINTAQPSGGTWLSFVSPGVFDLAPNESRTINTLTTPNAGLNQLAFTESFINVVSNDPIHPNYRSRLYGQTLWYAEFYQNDPDLPVSEILQTETDYSLGTDCFNFSPPQNLAHQHYMIGQLPPCTGDWVFTIYMSTGSADIWIVTLGTAFLQGTVVGDNSVALSPQGFTTPGGGLSNVMTVTFRRPTTPSFNKTSLVMPSNLRVDGLPWILNMFADWRVATAVAWAVQPSNTGTGGGPYSNGDTIMVNVTPTSPWACLVTLVSSMGPVHQESWTLTPTHTEPGSVGSWDIFANSNDVNSTTAPTLYGYSITVVAPFLLNNVAPQTADVTMTYRKTDCTTETRLVHLQFFDVPDGTTITSRSAIDYFTGSETQLGPGPTPLLMAGEINWWDQVGPVYTEYAVQFSVVPVGVGHTFQWQRQVSFGVWTNLSNNGAFPYVSGVTTGTLNLGGPTPGALVTTGQMGDLPGAIYRVLVNSTAASGYNLAPAEDA